MAKIKSGFCKKCCKQTKVEKGGVNHIPHLLGTLLTAGIWFPFWFLACLFGEWRCVTCGYKVKGAK